MCPVPQKVSGPNTTACFCLAESRSDLSRVVPGDLDSGVQLRRGRAVQDQPLPLQALHRPAGVQVDPCDVAHWNKRGGDRGVWSRKLMFM